MPSDLPDTDTAGASSDWEKWMRASDLLTQKLGSVISSALQSTTGKPIVYEAFTQTLAENGTPTQLLGYDLSRTRALVRASAADVFIGKMDQLAGGGLGYPLPVASGDEIKTTDAVYVVSRPSTLTGVSPLVTVFVEKTQEG